MVLMVWRMINGMLMNFLKGIIIGLMTVTKIIVIILLLQSLLVLGRMACATDATMTEVCTCNNVDNCNSGQDSNYIVHNQT